MKNFSTMQLFLKVVEAGSFSAAARTLGLTPSAVSRQISQLENDLGGRIFQRTTRRQSLTEAGEAYFRHVSRIVEDIDIAHKAVRNLTGMPAGELRVTAEANFALSFIEPVLAEFFELYPKIQLSLNLSANYHDLINDNFDLAIRIGQLESSNLIARKLTESRSIICASPEYLDKHGIPCKPEELISHSCLSFRTEFGKKYWKFSVDEELVNIPINGRMQVNNLLFLRKAALNGLGVVMIPVWMVGKDLQEKKLIPILEEHPTIPPSTPVNMIFPSKQQLAPKVRVFIDFLSKRI